MFPFTTGQPDQQPDSQPDQSPDRTAERRPDSQTAADTDPLLRTDLTAPGIRGLVERVVLGSASSRRFAGVVLTMVALAVGVYFGYSWLVGFSPNADFFNPGIGLMVFGGQAAQAFFPRTPDRYPYTGYTVVNAVETAVLGYVVFTMATRPLDSESVMFMVGYATVACMVTLTGLVATTRMRRGALLLAEQQADKDAMRRALHMDR